LDSCGWTGRTVEYHRAQSREHPSFRQYSAAAAEKLTAYPVTHVAHKEHRPERGGWQLPACCRAKDIEPPSLAGAGVL
jgi:hypothetical protein